MTNNIVLCFDGDEAGEKATVHAIELLEDTNIDLFANNQTSKNASDGSNYIKLVFTNPSNAMFKVTFIGYYNK